MLRNLNRCDLYIVLFILYQLRDILYPDGIINELLMLSMLFITIIETINTVTKQIPLILKVALVLVLMYTIYGSWTIISDTTLILKDGRIQSNSSYLLASLRSLLPIFMFYYYTKKGFLDERRIKIYTFVFLALSLKSFYQNKYVALAEFNKEETTNNAAYGFLNLIPLIYFFYKKTYFQYVLFGIICLFMIAGMKRGVMLIGGISILFFIYSNLKGSSYKKKIIIIGFSLVLIIGAGYYITTMLQSSEYFAYRIERTREGSSSGRDLIFSSLLNIFYNESNILYILFGHGAYSTIELIGIQAHNDWLETLINNGILGAFILLLFFIVLTRTAVNQQYKFPPYMYYSFLLVVFIMFCKTLFSMCILEIGSVHSMLLGYFAYWSSRPKEDLINMK